MKILPLIPFTILQDSSKILTNKFLHGNIAEAYEIYVLF